MQTAASNVLRAALTMVSRAAPHRTTATAVLTNSTSTLLMGFPFVQSPVMTIQATTTLLSSKFLMESWSASLATKIAKCAGDHKMMSVSFVETVLICLREPSVLKSAQKDSRSLSTIWRDMSELSVKKRPFIIHTIGLRTQNATKTRALSAQTEEPNPAQNARAGDFYGTMSALRSAHLRCTPTISLTNVWNVMRIVLNAGVLVKTSVMSVMMGSNLPLICI